MSHPLVGCAFDYVGVDLERVDAEQPIVVRSSAATATMATVLKRGHGFCGAS